MSWMLASRVANGLALASFLLPWIVAHVPDGRRIAASPPLQQGMSWLGNVLSQSWMQGEMSFGGVDDKFLRFGAALAGALILAGLWVSFSIKPLPKASGAVAWLCGTAASVCVLAMYLFFSGLNRQGVGAYLEVGAGYWLSLGGLVTATLSAAFARQGRAFPDIGRMVAATGAAGAASTGSGGTDRPTQSADQAQGREASGDAAYWDSMADKADPAALEEYVYRFPEGRFVDLAKLRLERASRQFAPPAAVSEAIASSSKPANCSQCEVPLKPNARCCENCGAAVP